MNARREVLQIIFGALLLALFMAVGILKSTNPFYDNVVGGILVMIISRFLARIFGGKQH